MNVVVTGGGTVAPIDDVRFIANVSSGRFSASISEACLELGATVRHIHTPSAELPILRNSRFNLDADPLEEQARLERLRDNWRTVRDRLHLIPLAKGTVADYSATLKSVLQDHSIDIAFLAMAVSDYEPETFDGKIDSDADTMTIHCRKTPKVIRHVRDWSPDLYLVGFKLLSRVDPDELRKVAEHACLTNRVDMTVANDLQSLQQGRHAVQLVRPGQPSEFLGPDPGLASLLVKRVFELFEGRRS